LDNFALYLKFNYNSTIEKKVNIEPDELAMKHSDLKDEPGDLTPSQCF